MPTDSWKPEQYQLFRRERQRPFFDLLGMMQPPDRRIARVVDLGCGTGELTAELATRYSAATVLGLDSSQAMLDQAAPLAGPRLSFRRQDIATFDEWADCDVVFSNAALHWVPDHAALFDRLLSSLRPGAELAAQMPANDHHDSHRVAAEVAASPPFASLLRGWVRATPVEPGERYAERLDAHGFREARVEERIYGHALSDESAVVEWVKGTLLTAYLARLDDQDGAAFLDAYRSRLRAALGRHAPYFYTYRRLLLWGRKSA